MNGLQPSVQITMSTFEGINKTGLFELSRNAGLGPKHYVKMSSL